MKKTFLETCIQFKKSNKRKKQPDFFNVPYDDWG